jgi:hypothetical protein
MTEQLSEYREILLRLDALKDKTPQIPLIDPTANVKELVEMERRHHNEMAEAAQKRQDDLREQAERFTEKLFAERRIADGEAKRAEAGRIDALLVANTNNVALALEKQGAQAQAQDKRIAALEQNQYQGVGASGQQREGRQQNQWTFQQTLTILAIAIAIASFVVHIWK